MNKMNVVRIKTALVIGLLAALTGCIGFWGRGYYHGTVVVSEPDQYLFGVIDYNGRDVHRYSHRGYESREAAHSGKSHRETHSRDDQGRRR